MKVKVNEQVLEIAENSVIEQLLITLNKPTQGCAVAVNKEIVSRSKWSEFELNEGDQISLFQAIAGG